MSATDNNHPVAEQVTTGDRSAEQGAREHWFRCYPTLWKLKIAFEGGARGEELRAAVAKATGAQS